ncbi:MAG TPA: hypothetical protein VFL99_16905 [Segeticoccus sp.]|uniref:hypothetical protein n=1 Tax=Segeticoccus sp. TaxID=2706531 RepID=UPI002D803330|nr:hypothetical protein [Segeticoccus sp.]HET8602007.1 hypothetical protein [Segeticoccus sp.]
MLKIEVDTQAGNKALMDGTLPKIIQQVMDRAKPEATYYGTEGGCRTAFVFFDLADSSDIPAVAEPAFQQLGAKVTLTPVMNDEDLQRGLSQLR